MFSRVGSLWSGRSAEVSAPAAEVPPETRPRPPWGRHKIDRLGFH